MIKTHYQKKYLSFFGFFMKNSFGLYFMSAKGILKLNLPFKGIPNKFFCYFSCDYLIFLLFCIFL